MTLALLCLSLPYTAPRPVLGEPCEDEEFEGNVVVIYCYLLLLSLLLWIISTCVWLVVLDAHHLPNLCVQKGFFTFAFQIYYFSCSKRKCVCSWFSFWVLISAHLFASDVCITSALLGNGLFLTACTGHLQPAFLLLVCLSRTEVPNVWFSVPISHLNESELFCFTEFAFASVLV